MTLHAWIITMRGRIREALVPELQMLRDQNRDLRAEVERLRADSLRYKWITNRVLACDYGNNNAPGEQIGWRIRGDLRADAEPFMLGASINAAIDAALKETK